MATATGMSATAPADIRKELGGKAGVGAGQRSFLNATGLSAQRKSELAKYYLRPEKPKAWTGDPDMWLDSNNIADVMKQYEESNSEFEFMGPFPIDFAAQDPYEKSSKKCLITEVCNFRVEKSLAAGKKYIGIVYNLDPHFKSGSHWVANFIDIPRKMCYYFDSYGMKPPDQVAKFMKWITTHDPDIRLQSNGRRFQKRNTECGMYSIYFIIRMLAGDNFKTFVRREPPDEFMLKLRDWLFST
jgi:hypothetical protein